MWTVLSSPVQGLEFDQKFLDLLDTNKDGKIRTEEVIAAGKYVTDVIKNKDLVLNGDSSLPLSEFNEESEEGKKLHDSAVQILKNLAQLGIESEIYTEAARILDYQRKKTTQKVNLYEKVQIPGYIEAIRKIKRYMEDEENLSKASQKIVKNKHILEEEEADHGN